MFVIIKIWNFDYDNFEIIEWLGDEGYTRVIAAYKFVSEYKHKKSYSNNYYQLTKLGYLRSEVRHSKINYFLIDLSLDGIKKISETAHDFDSLICKNILNIAKIINREYKIINLLGT